MTSARKVSVPQCPPIKERQLPSRQTKALRIGAATQERMKTTSVRG